MKELNLINEPSIGRVTLPTGETAPWFYNPDTTKIARFATRVVFRPNEYGQEYIYMLLLPNNSINNGSTVKLASIANDLGSVEGKPYKPYVSKNIYAIAECEITK
ncbi:hypothetical protein [Vibrio gallicus]|uniref:hypothetical protein n=1 Tax=Vibrio gallicus TaxID=190897 RepID=UPI0021C2A698|nr:hypothetical protein [Vibrio gallicus]